MVLDRMPMDIQLTTILCQTRQRGESSKLVIADALTTRIPFPSLDRELRDSGILICNYLANIS